MAGEEGTDKVVPEHSLGSGMNAVNTKYTCCSTRFYHHTAALLSLARNEISNVQCEATVEIGEPSRLQKSKKSVTSACRPPTPAQGRHGTTADTRRWKDPHPPALPASPVCKLGGDQGSEMYFL